MEKHRYQKRTFLNTNVNQRAYVIASVRDCTDEFYSDVRLELADCSRYINLDFNFGHNKTSLKRATKKLKLFKEIINDFVDAVQTEIDFKMQNPPKKRKNGVGVSSAEYVG